MTSSLLRRTRQVAQDAVLRRWLVERVVGRARAPTSFVAHRPPYLDGALPLGPEAPAADWPELSPAPPTESISIALAGTTVTLDPGGEDTLFERPFADIETRLALHRFAWVPVLGAAAEPAWVGVLWRAWALRHGRSDGSWAWQPYTAAERVVNIIRFATRHGLPAPRAEALALIAAHAPAIAGGLEYFGEHHTSNHLANDGRGLYLTGLALGLPRAAEIGARILVHEAGRIFLPSGVLREGSSHYQLLLARTYAEAWLAARARGRPEAAAFEGVVKKALTVASRLDLPGGIALVGDVSPDCPPGHLAGLVPGADDARGWLAALDDHDRQAFVELRESVAPADENALAADGWLRLDAGPWAALWHAAPGGWSWMPGHGHQDAGSFEVHHRGLALFRDLGRGAYGETGEAAFYRSALAHNTLVVDGVDPYPPNRPYYDAAFRERVGGPPPRLVRERDEVRLVHHGFARLKGVGATRRRWRFAPSGFELIDGVEGSGTRRITRRLATTLAVEIEDTGALIRSQSASFRLAADAPVTLAAATCWRAYGEGIPATILDLTVEGRLPWQGRLTVEVL